MNIYNTAATNAATNYANMFKTRKLLSPGFTNAKTKKNELESFILYLSPADQNSKGINICPAATAECIKLCLNTSGHGAFNSVQRSRIERTEFYLNDRINFINKILNELYSINKKAEKKGEKIAVRLNGTSDLDFIAIIKNRTGIDILEDMPNILFYDYTKLIGKVRKYAGTNYVLTFSRSETNEAECLEALSLGANIAAVFYKTLPAEYMGRPVLDGDTSDLVMINNRSTILGLKAKGRAKKVKESGFVIF
jgi:hypothetical protein